ncbi:DUF871 domain-containing protein [Vaginisenegalia massiliensis]|uniref:DUF871 domain-containing protein n=1 Tax=Vaginisenegalia massiliensis TaxID=2058294 RepID=UPI000F51F192|nr:MupG family TIM beta-alpha barrel fold protein [Vaginisenegalia massiliensis]
MRQLGISIYPDKSSKEDIMTYLADARKAGCSRIFSCLLSVNKSKEEIVQEFKEINHYANELGYEIIVDVAPRIFKDLEISYQDLSFFKEIEADGLRLDVGFTGAEEAMMTYNQYGLKIEINMSNNVHTLDTIMDYQPNPYCLQGCHNFYPHGYSGLNLEFFKKCTQRFKAYGLRTAAFVTSQNQNTFGPWPVTQGLPTLEMHRNLPMHVQIKHLLALGEIDDILISNCYPSSEELKQVQGLDLSLVTFDVQLIEDLSTVERAIVLDELHFSRGDQSDYFIRSTQSRVKYKGHEFKLHHAPSLIRRGDIIIESSLYGHYAGELQIALRDMPNSGMSNVVGSISSDECFILDAIKPWQKFKFREAIV